jgi:hypothetical protein
MYTNKQAYFPEGNLKTKLTLHSKLMGTEKGAATQRTMCWLFDDALSLLRLYTE